MRKYLNCYHIIVGIFAAHVIDHGLVPQVTVVAGTIIRLVAGGSSLDSVGYIVVEWS